MERMQLTPENVKNAASNVVGARYLWVTEALYPEALSFTVIKEIVKLCPMVLYKVTGKMWGVTAEEGIVEHLVIDDVAQLVKLYDGSTEDEAAQTVREPSVPPKPRSVKREVTPHRRWPKRMTESGMEAIEEMGEAA